MDGLLDYALPGEEWKEVSGFPNFLISNYGRVWNVRKEKPVPMQQSQWRTVEAKPRRTKRTYLRVQLYGRNTEGKAITKAAVVHRLVALAFIHNDDPEHKTIVDHINNDPFDNRASNLRWVTNGQNLKNAQTNEQAYTRWLIQNLQREKIDENAKEVQGASDLPV